MSTSRFRPLKALARGVNGKCPHCGVGAMLDGWVSARDRCPECGLVYERKHGDTWAFWVVGDRIPVFVAIAVIYFGLKPEWLLGGMLEFGALVAALVLTTPYRMGLILAVHYVSRVYWPDPDDPVPMAGSILSSAP